MIGPLTLRVLQCPINKLKNAAPLTHHFIYLYLLHAAVIQKDARMGALVLPPLFHTWSHSRRWILLGALWVLLSRCSPCFNRSLVLTAERKWETE